MDALEAYRMHVETLRKRNQDKVPVFNPSVLNTAPRYSDNMLFTDQHEKLIEKIVKIRPLTLRGYKSNGIPIYDMSVVSRELSELYQRKDAPLSAENLLTLERLNELASTVFVRSVEQYGLEKVGKHYGLTPEEAKKASTVMTDYFSKTVQKNTNCYAAASGTIHTGSLMSDSPITSRPGQNTSWQSVKELSGNLTAFTRQIHRGALKDGYIHVGKNPKPIEGHIMVAVYTGQMRSNNERSRLDYHYVYESRSPDGQLMWVSKWGANKATPNDKAGMPITDPKKADMGKYVFQGYLARPIEGLPVGRRPEVADPDLNGSSTRRIGGGEGPADVKRQPPGRSSNP